MNGRPEFILLNVNVTQEDIDFGRERDCWYCPIALAVRRAASEGKIPGAAAHAGRFDIQLFCDYGRYSCLTPRACEDFMHSFDVGWLSCEFPFSFALNFHFADDQRIVRNKSTGEVSLVLTDYKAKLAQVG